MQAGFVRSVSVGLGSEAGGIMQKTLQKQLSEVIHCTQMPAVR
jgi:hypothetical protein